MGVSSEHGDEVLKSAANAMYHSSTVAASAAYDKDGSDRIVGSAMEGEKVKRCKSYRTVVRTVY